LSEISWYKAPSDDAIRNEEKRSGKVNKHPKPQVIPTMRTGLQPAQINVGHVIPYADKGWCTASTSSAQIRSIVVVPAHSSMISKENAPPRQTRLPSPSSLEMVEPFGN
jgi:hypothetical protein